MDQQHIERAATLLVDARNTGASLAALPADCRPDDFGTAHAIQDLATRKLAQDIVGWKVFVPEGGTCRGALLASGVRASPGELRSAHLRTRGAEGEIAFRLRRDLPPRDAEYSFDEVADAVAAGPAIEVVETRFAVMNDVTWAERVADHFCNGGFVHGQFRDDWQALDLERIAVTLLVDGEVAFAGTGGHAAGHPLVPAVALVNLMRREGGVAAGRIITTGSFTGMRPSRVGETVRVSFEGLGSAELRFVP